MDDVFLLLSELFWQLWTCKDENKLNVVKYVEVMRNSDNINPSKILRMRKDGSDCG